MTQLVRIPITGYLYAPRAATARLAGWPLAPPASLLPVKEEEGLREDDPFVQSLVPFLTRVASEGRCQTDTGEGETTVYKCGHQQFKKTDRTIQRTFQNNHRIFSRDSKNFYKRFAKIFYKRFAQIFFNRFKEFFLKDTIICFNKSKNFIKNLKFKKIHS